MDFIPWLRKGYTASVELRNYLSSVFISPVTSDHTWPIHTDAVLKKAHQCLFFLRELGKLSVSPKTLILHMHSGEHPDRNCTTLNCKALQRVVQTAQNIVGGELPSLQDIYTRWCVRKAQRIIRDSSHPSHGLLSPLPSGRRSCRTRTSRLRDEFFPQAIRLLNSYQ